MKRARCANYTNAEIIHLLKLVEKYPVIENKKTDGATTKEKNAAWQNLCIEYNAQTNFGPRTADSLLCCYKNQKMKFKRMLSKEQNMNSKEQPMSSSGCPVADDDDDGIHRTDSISTMYDGEDEVIKEQQVWLPEDILTQTVELESSHSSVSEQDSNKDGYSKQLNNIKKNIDIILGTSIKAKKKANMSNSVQELAQDKQELVKAQKTLTGYRVYHHKLLISLAKEKLRFEKEKNQMELKFLKEKYELELELLRNKKNN